MIGDLIFTRWNGWDDLVILLVQWIYSHFRPAFRPYWRWTHVQVVIGEDLAAHATGDGVSTCRPSEHNVHANGLRRQAVAAMGITDATDQAQLVAYARSRLGERYDRLAFVWIGIQLLSALRIMVGVDGQDVCSEYAGHCEEHAGQIIPAIGRSPMHLAAWAHCPRGERV